MSHREAGLAVVLLALLAPVLAFPKAFGPGNVWIVSIVAMMTLAAAVVLLRHFGLLAWLAGLFAVAVVAGWLRARGQLLPIDHFGGIALGLFAMSTVAIWCQTRQRLLIGTAAILAFGVLVLSVGYRSTPTVHKRKVLMGDTSAVPPPVTPLPLSGLHARETVNTNALAATAMMVLPVAAAVALVPARWISWPGALQVAAGTTAFWAAAITALMQSRSAWLSAVIVFWLWMRTWLGPRMWRVATAAMFLVVPGILLLLWRDHPRGAEVVATLVGRINIWDDAVEAFRTSPWLGIGLDYFRHSGYSMVLAPPDQMVGTPHAHNIFLQTALDIGLIGLAAYLALLAFVMRRGLELARETDGDTWVRAVGIGAALSVVSVHAYGLLDAVSLGTKVGAFQWLSSGLILAAWRIDRGK